MVQTFGMWLQHFTAKSISVHNMADIYFVTPQCSCGGLSVRFVYTVDARLINHGFIVPRNSSVAHLFLCVPCDKAQGVYVHPGVTSMVGKGAVACGRKMEVLTRSPAWS